MARLLLDSHILLWYFHRNMISLDTLVLIAQAQARHTLFVSPISAWELGVATQKKNESRRPNLEGSAIDVWFKDVTSDIGARVVNIDSRIASEASIVAERYGSRDPGDCLLIATARLRKLTLVTRDERILSLAAEWPEYVKVVRG